MKKLVFTGLTMIAFVAVLTVVFVDPVSAAPAMPQQRLGCFVEDANFVRYFDPDCTVHRLFKTDSEGNIVALLNYQDHGHVPPGAALPSSALVSVFYAECDCIYEGLYRQVLMPNGSYRSQGPMARNN